MAYKDRDKQREYQLRERAANDSLAGASNFTEAERD